MNDSEAFAQMQRFIRVTGRALEVFHGQREVRILNYDPGIGLCEGWNEGDPTLPVVGSTFAAAWTKFCGYWPEAAKS